VREDYSPDGAAWDYLPHDHARSRAYRWGEDGLFGWCDKDQHLCLSLALWNGCDAILKERFFGLTNSEGNHGEDAKDLWWHVDALPSHAWNRMLYAYPQDPFPYEDLVRVNGTRSRGEREYELPDTGILDGGRFFEVWVTYAKRAHDETAMRIEVVNRLSLELTAANHTPEALGLGLDAGCARHLRTRIYSPQGAGCHPRSGADHRGYGLHRGQAHQPVQPGRIWLRYDQRRHHPQRHR
jgi:hypothetical protein